MIKSRFLLAVAAYFVPVFILGVAWHLFLFDHVYRSLAIYRADLIFPLGILSMLIQGSFLTWLYPRIAGSGHWFSEGLRFAAITGIAFWSALVLPVAAKNVMTSVSTFIVIETAFTFCQFMIVGPLIAFIYSDRPQPAAGSRQ